MAHGAAAEHERVGVERLQFVRPRRAVYPDGSAGAASDPTGVVGMLRLKKSARSARTARTDNVTRSPAIRASAFSSTIAVAVAGGTPASSSACSRSASEMKGTPLVSSVCAFDDRSLGTAGLLAMPEKKDAVSADMRIAPD